MSLPEPSLPGAAFHAFGAVLVISRQGPHARKDTMETLLGQAGIDHEFFNATMGVDLSAAELAAAYDEQAALRHKTLSRRLHPSHVGSCLSHRRAWAEVLNRKLDSALVLEDDAQPVSERLHALPALLAELPPDWHLLYLGIRGHRHAPVLFGIKRRVLLPLARLLLPRRYRLTPAEASRLYLRPFSSLLYRAGYHQGAHAYAVSRKGAETLLEQLGRVTAPIDAELGTMVLEGKLNAYAAREDLFVPTGAPSQIVSSL
jgi:GR25 family glycosyltransferase involved in LPS biosynthesis